MNGRGNTIEFAGFGAGFQNLAKRGFTDEHLVDSGNVSVVIDAEGRGGVSLGIEINHQHASPGVCEGRGKVNGRCGLTHATLLIGD
jgi:hypothetical protein